MTAVHRCCDGANSCKKPKKHAWKYKNCHKKGSIHINVSRTGTHVTYGYINKCANLYDISEINRTKILIFF